MKAKVLWTAVIFFAVTLLGCDKLPWLGDKGEGKVSAPPKDAVVVAKVDDIYITADDLNREVETFNTLVDAQGVPQSKIETRDQKISYLRDDMVRKFMLYKEALKRGLEKKDDIQMALREAEISLLVTELLRQEVEKIEISPEEIEEFYDENKEILKEPEQRKILEIVTDTEDQAKEVYIELLKGTSFSALARMHSKAASASSGGDIGSMTFEFDPELRTKFDEFYTVAFAPSLEAGNTSSIFKGPDGYYIIKVDDITTSDAKPLSELWDMIKSYLLFVKQQKAIGDLADRLSGETKIEIYEGKI